MEWKKRNQNFHNSQGATGQLSLSYNSHVDFMPGYIANKECCALKHADFQQGKPHIIHLLLNITFRHPGVPLQDAKKTEYLLPSYK